MTAIARLLALTARLDAEPAVLDAVRGEGDTLADQTDGPEDLAPEGHDDPARDAALRWRIAVVRAVIAAPPDGDAVRELYGALVDHYRDQPARLAALRPLGAEIRRLEAAGVLASSLVARSDRRPHRR